MIWADNRRSSSSAEFPHVSKKTGAPLPEPGECDSPPSFKQAFLACQANGYRIAFRFEDQAVPFAHAEALAGVEQSHGLSFTRNFSFSDHSLPLSQDSLPMKTRSGCRRASGVRAG